MKKLLLSCLFLSGLFVLMQSCQKDLPQSEVIREIMIDTTISTNTDYYFDLAPLGDEDKVATILEKGKNYSISRLEDETDMFTSIYHYKPDAKATGTDRVVLAISQNPQGRAVVSKDSTIIYINFTVR